MKFRRQEPIGPFIADFLAPEEWLIVELDGGQHAEPEAAQRDFDRTRELEKRGFRVLRFWNGDVLHDLESVLLTIQRALADRQRQL